jgi:hypothetical protein
MPAPFACRNRGTKPLAKGGFSKFAEIFFAGRVDFGGYPFDVVVRALE